MNRILPDRHALTAQNDEVLNTSMLDNVSSNVMGQVIHASRLKSCQVRVGSIDAYRGLVMLLMMAEVLALRQVARGRRQSHLLAFLAH